MKKVVVIGGGTGLSTLLRGLRDYPIDITAVVTMTDDGASSGKLRKSQGILPPGDVRKCIAALSTDESGLTDLFEYRYQQGFGLKGHSVGNLFITALSEMTGSFELAVEKVSDILNIQGVVLPATLDDVHLLALFEDGRQVVGQVKILKYAREKKIKEISLSVPTKTNPRALAAINSADIIFVGPGSLYTSIIPSLLQKKLSLALSVTTVPKIYIANVSTERGETDNFTLEDHLRTLNSYHFFPDVVLVNNGSSISKGEDEFVHKVQEEGVAIKQEKRQYADLINAKNPLYHDSNKLGENCYRLILSSNKLLKKR